MKKHCLYSVLICLALASTGSVSGKAEEVLVGIGAETQETGEAQWRAPEVNSDRESAQSEDGEPAGSLNRDTSDGGKRAAEGEPAVSREDAWMLILVNRTHPIPEGYEIPKLTELARGHAIDSRAYPALQSMFDAARAEGLSPYITSSFRTEEKQQELMDDKIQEYIVSGYSQEDAVVAAEEWVAIPGTSEHQLGLSVDISVDPDTGLDPGAVWYWLQEHSWEYGFIRRYPEEKKEITKIINEPWHFRYVGEKAAKEIYESGLCLEEYLGED